MHVFLEAEVATVEADCFVDIVHDVSHADSGHGIARFLTGRRFFLNLGPRCSGGARPAARSGSRRSTVASSGDDFASGVLERGGRCCLGRRSGAARRATRSVRRTRDGGGRDVGCGCGATAVELATLVGTSGRVVGLDVSAPMLERARERVSGLPVELLLGDAATYPLPPASFDVLFSRFGVMFFEDP